MTPNESAQFWKAFYGQNLGYIQQLYEQYLNDPKSIDRNIRDLFEKWGPPSTRLVATSNNVPKIEGDEAQHFLSKTVALMKLIENIRIYGHLLADIHPITINKSEYLPFLNLESYDLEESDLQRIPATLLIENVPEHVENVLHLVQFLKDKYTKTVAYEFDHIYNPDEREWLKEAVETNKVVRSIENDEKINILSRLIQVEVFESFLHKIFVGQKRFSIEGVDMLVPMLDEIINSSLDDGIRNIMIGMAHRGRLNVLAHVLGKPYKEIFSEFLHSPNKELIPSEGSRGINYGWSGDVKYHLGAKRDIQKDKGQSIRLTLANNPSHLEFVNPVVEGYTRAVQEDVNIQGYPLHNVEDAFNILIHGDAAFIGEGIVAETLNLTRLRGYGTGGAIHIITNNLLGFTTDYTDSRSTTYASDLAKGFEIPIIHVNADDPEACIKAINLAYQYRKKFKKDFIIDLVGYRRFGHNEMDDPSVTQPILYKEIKNHKTVATIYSAKLENEQIIPQSFLNKNKKKLDRKLTAIYDSAKTQSKNKPDNTPIEYKSEVPHTDTTVPLKTLKKLTRQLHQWPEEFSVYPKLKRIFERRFHAFSQENIVDWSLAESLAFATILKDGMPIRLTGQDSERGTFAHRHLVLHDHKTGKIYIPMHNLTDVDTAFAVYNSPLSEAAVLGFEYGYSIQSSKSLVIWEAQFGDFANAAQVILDQFISSGRAKWRQISSIVLLLPHGYEGQGPEHSSARLERYLQLAAENNWIVVNITSAAQYFHLLRRQSAMTGTAYAKPLVIMSPKSLLRHSYVSSDIHELCEGEFHSLLQQDRVNEKKEAVSRIIICSGKISIDLLAKQNENNAMNWDWLHIARLEQIYPFPKLEIKNLLDKHPYVKELIWVQEEPINMGAWTYVQPRLEELAGGIQVRYIGRPDHSSPATGDPDTHKAEQESILDRALKLSTRRPE